MEFRYNSTRYGISRNIPNDIVEDIRKFLDDKFKSDMTTGELQDLLLSYREPNGEGLLINHLEPIFVYLAQTGKLW